MSDTTTPPAPEPAPDLSSLDQGTLSRLIAQLTGPQAPPPVVSGSASSHDGRGFLSLLGEALGGGQQYGTTEEREQGGLAAAQAAGIRMLAASDYSRQPHTLGAIVAQGLGGAQQSLGQTQSVSAARQAAAFEQNRQQQQDQLARIKEAIPLLTLQQTMRAVANSPTTLGGKTPGGSIATGGSLGSVDVPPEYLPFYQEASARTGIPVEVLIAQGRQESGFNPGATGAAGEIGIGQISPKTATDPGYGMTGIKNPDALRDPRTNINFQADYLAARAKAAGADFSTPEGIAKALKAYNGGGDPNYVQNVTRYIPGARTALAPPAPGQNAAPGQPPTPPPTQARPVLPPPEAPLAPGAGGALVAGGPGAPGAPTSGVIPPSPPGSAADVADIVSGMVARGADPTTLAPGTGSAPAPSGATVAGPAGPTAPVPGSYEEYRLLHPITPSADDLAGFRTTPDPSILAEMTAQQARAQQQYGLARSKGDLAGMQKAESDFNTVATKMTELRQNAVKLGTDTRAKFMADQDAARRAAWAKDVEDQRKQADAERTQQNAIRLKEIEGEQTRQSTAAGAVVARNQKALEGLDTDSAAAAKQLPQLDALRVLSDNVPDGSGTTLRNLANVTVGGTPLITHMANLGMADPTKVGAIQQLQGAISGTVAELRQGISMGQLSDRDLDFISSLGPRLYEDQGTRSAVISYLKQARQVKMRFNAEVSKEMTRPGMDFATASEKVAQDFETKHPVVPQMPSDLYANRTNPDPGWQKKVVDWAQSNNVKQHTLFRKPDGSLELVR